MIQILKSIGLAILCVLLFQMVLYAQDEGYWEKAENKANEAGSRIGGIYDGQTRSYGSDHDYEPKTKSSRQQRLEYEREEQDRRDQERHDQAQRELELRQQEENKKNALIIYRELDHKPSDPSVAVSKYKNYYAEQQHNELIAEGVAATEKMAREFIQENSFRGSGLRKDLNTLLTELDQAWKENTDKDNMERQLRELSDGIGKIVPEGASKFSYGFLNAMYDGYTSTFFLLKDFYLQKDNLDYLTSFSFYRDLIHLSGKTHQDIWTPIVRSYGENLGNSLFLFLHGTSEQRGYAAFHLYGLTKTARTYSKQISHAYFNRASIDFRNPSQLGRAISGSGSLDLSPDNEIQRIWLNVKKGKELKGLLKPLIPPVRAKEEK